MSKRIMVYDNASDNGRCFVADLDKVDAMGYQKVVACPADNAKPQEFYITINGIQYTHVEKIVIGVNCVEIEYKKENFPKLVKDFLIDTFTPAE